MQAPHPESFQLLQMFSPSPSCWVAQEASAPLSVLPSPSRSAKPITSMGAAPLFSLQAASAVSKNYRSSHTQKYRGIYAILEGFGHPGRDFGHLGGFWPTQEMLCQRRWRLMGTAFSSWLWGKGDLHHCKWGSDTLPVSPKLQPAGRQTGVFLVGCEILGVLRLPRGPSSCPAGSRKPGPCSTPPVRHCHPWSCIQALQWPNPDPPGWHSWFSLRMVPFLPSLDHTFWHQGQQCPGPQAPVSGQRDTSRSQGKLRQETSARLPQPQWAGRGCTP